MCEFVYVYECECNREFKRYVRVLFCCLVDLGRFEVGLRNILRFFSVSFVQVHILNSMANPSCCFVFAYFNI